MASWNKSVGLIRIESICLLLVAMGTDRLLCCTTNYSESTISVEQQCHCSRWSNGGRRQTPTIRRMWIGRVCALQSCSSDRIAVSGRFWYILSTTIIEQLVVATHTGHLVVYDSATSSSFRAEDVLIEMNIGIPIVALAAGRFMPRADRHQLAVLHPRKLTVYGLVQQQRMRLTIENLY